jgi:hypothetical protein
MKINEALIRLEECSHLEDLERVWKTHWPTWKNDLGPIDLRKVVAKKDEVKLNIARAMLTQNSGDIDIQAVILTTVRAILAASPSLPPAWSELAASGLTEYDVTSVEEGLFLYALELVKSVEPNALVKVWEAYGPWWKRRVPVAAYAIIQDTLYARLKAQSLSAFKEAKYGRF